MIIEDKFTISASIQQVWDFFLDIPSVSQCVPGAQQVEQVDEQTYTGSLGVKVGPISANFNGKAILTEVEPPRRLSARAEGKDKNTASMVSATFTANLAEIGPGQTEVSYALDVAIRGRLGQFGQSVIRETAKQVSQAFAACVQARLAERLEATPQVEASTEAHPDGVPGSTLSAAISQAQPVAAPSLLSILFKAMAATIGNWFRSLWLRSN